MSESKILLFIVEGPSDEASLAPAMEKIVSNSTVKFKVMHCDIVSDYDSTVANIERRIKDLAVGRYLKLHPQFLPKDICGVVHIVDLDGAFSPDSVVRSGAFQDVEYYDDKIICKDEATFLMTKQNKRSNLLHLISLSEIKIPNGIKVPYSIYYMACNLDHVLHNKRNSTFEEKKADSITFADCYDDPQKFEEFFNNTGIKVDGTYVETWKYAQRGMNSLKRGSNFWLCINRYKS